MSEHVVRLTLPCEEVLFNNHSREYEHENDWLCDQVAEQWEDASNYEDQYIVTGYQPIALEEGFIILQVTVEVDA